MSNSYYTPTGNPVATTKGLSGQVRSEFSSVEIGFDGVTTSLALKGNLSGSSQAWSGTHIYTGTYTYTGATVVLGAATTGVTQTTGDSSTKLATTAFVANTSFSTNLPAQAGKQRGSVLVTDGTNASWNSPPIGSVLYLATLSVL